MTFLELCQQVLSECTGQSGPSAVTGQTGITKKVVGWVAASDVFVQSLYADWNFLWGTCEIQTSLATDVLASPAGVGTWDQEGAYFSRGLEDGRPLRFVGFKEWREYSGIKENEEPQSVTIKPDNNLVLKNPADGIYLLTFNYWKLPTKMVANTDTPLIPAQFERVIISRAKMRYAEDQEVPALYQIAATEYAEVLDQLKAKHLPGQSYRSQAQPRQMVVRAD